MFLDLGEKHLGGDGGDERLESPLDEAITGTSAVRFGQTECDLAVDGGSRGSNRANP